MATDILDSCYFVKGVLANTTDILSGVLPIPQNLPSMSSNSSLSFDFIGKLTRENRKQHPVTWSFALDTHTASGTIFIDDKPFSWDMVKDNYLILGYKKDYSTLWKNDIQQFTSRSQGNDINSLLMTSLKPALTGPADWVDCDGCGNRSEMLKSPFVVKPPEYLILSVKRISYDVKMQKLVKNLQDVDYAPIIELPAVPDNIQELVRYDAITDERRVYSLYGIVIHTGATANAGHYYAYARNSESDELWRVDASDAPWIKFNDQNLKHMTWNGVKNETSSKVADTVYVLFYKRLSQQAIDLMHTSNKIKNNVDGNKENKSSIETEEEDLLSEALKLSMDLDMEVTKDNNNVDGNKENKSNIETEEEDLLSEALKLSMDLDMEVTKDNNNVDVNKEIDPSRYANHITSSTVNIHPIPVASWVRDTVLAGNRDFLLNAVQGRSSDHLRELLRYYWLRSHTHNQNHNHNDDIPTFK